MPIKYSDGTVAVLAKREVWERFGAIARECDVPDMFSEENEELQELMVAICYEAGSND